MVILTRTECSLRSICRVPLDVTLEFRAFVVNGNLTAISQYSNLVYVAEVANNKENVQSAIFQFFNENVRKQLAYVENEGATRLPILLVPLL